MVLLSSRGTKRFRTSDPSANPADAAAKNDRVGFVEAESLDAYVGVDDIVLSLVVHSEFSVSDDHENMS